MLTNAKDPDAISHGSVCQRPSGGMDLLSDALKPHKRLDLLPRQRHAFAEAIAPERPLAKLRSTNSLERMNDGRTDGVDNPSSRAP